MNSREEQSFMLHHCEIVSNWQLFLASNSKRDEPASAGHSSARINEEANNEEVIERIKPFTINKDQHSKNIRVKNEHQTSQFQRIIEESKKEQIDFYYNRQLRNN